MYTTIYYHYLEHYKGKGLITDALWEFTEASNKLIMEQDMKQEPIAQYKCLEIKCNYEYTAAPGPTQCPRCGHNYIKWVNYK